MKIQIIEIESIDELNDLKMRYIEETTGPLDGMWLCGFVPMASHYGFYNEEELVGYCCVNDEGYLLQFYLSQRNRNQSTRFLTSLLQADDGLPGKINGAFVSTAEPDYLSLCFDCFSKFEVNSLMYQLDKTAAQPKWLTQKNVLALCPVESEQLTVAVEFAVASIGAPADWLQGYFANLISRRELFGVWENGRLLSTGESRGYDEYQTGYADVGIIVAKPERGKGMATTVLKQLIAMNEGRGLKSICSTESTNTGAQTAISRAGFIARNRIIRFDA